MLGVFTKVCYRLANKNKAKAVAVDGDYLAQFKRQRIWHSPRKVEPSPGNRNLLITSALPYVNNTPHLGNIIGAVLSADVYARFCRLMGYNVLYVCGTDQYGTATEVKALQDKKTPKQICDTYHTIHKQIYQWFDISFDHFGRTSKPIHSKITQEIFADLETNGHIRSGSLRQFRCNHCDMFLADRFVRGTCNQCQAKARGDQCDQCSTIFNNPIEELLEPQCSICGQTPEPKETTHMFLKFDKTLPQVKEWLFKNELIETWTNNAKGTTKGWLNIEMRDRCITRDIKWGVPVPVSGFQNKAFYVWFEAPFGYISITADFLGESFKKWWFQNSEYKVELNQFMGKDNIIFHSILCPAALLGTNQKWVLPTKLQVTQYLMYEGGKFSKSNSVGVFGDECQSTKIPSEVWRFYLLSNRPEITDSQFVWANFAETTRQLSSTIGNLFHRILKAAYQEFPKTLPHLKHTQFQAIDLNFIQIFQQKFQKYLKSMEKVDIKSGLQAVLEIASLLNKYIQDTEFWKNKQRKILIFGLTIRSMKMYSLMLEPFMPALTAKINFLLGFSNQNYNSFGLYQQFCANFKEILLNCMSSSTGIRNPIVLINEITNEDVAFYKQKFGSSAEKSN